MQRIYFCALTPEAYAASAAHHQVVPEAECPICDEAGPLHCHGSYDRGITGCTGRVIQIPVARFFHPGCGRTISYLPSFAFSYRLVQAATFEAFLDGILGRRDVQSREDLLRQYRQRMLAYEPELRRVIGGHFGRAPPGPAALWPYLKVACGSRQAAIRLLQIRPQG